MSGVLGVTSSAWVVSWPALAVGLVLLAANGFFVAVEVALLAARRSRLDEAADDGDRAALRARRALAELPITLAGAQLGITASSIGLGVVAARAVVDPLEVWLAARGLVGGAVPVLAVVLGTGVVLLWHLILGEMAPKHLALARPEAVVGVLVRPFGWLLAVTRPLIMLVAALARASVRLVRVEPVDADKLVHTPDELALALAESQQRGTIAIQDARVMEAALRLSTIDAEAAMTPRVDLHTVADTATIAQVLAVADDTGHTRLPVYHEDVDHIVGIVHVKDALVARDDGLEVSHILRPIAAVPGGRDLERLLRDLLDEGNHAVLVVDEFGATAGLLTLEDVLEELVGEIDDEFDDEQHSRRQTDRVWVVPGTLRRDELARTTGVVLPGGDTETVSGWIVEQLGRLPAPGDRLTTPDHWQLLVRDLEGRRAGEVEVRAPGQRTESASADVVEAADEGPVAARRWSRTPRHPSPR